jgi:hypothetical protein
MRRWIAVLAVGALSLVAAQSVAAKKSTVVIQTYELGFFNGAIKSSFTACKQNRRVDLWEDENLDGAVQDSLVGTDKTDGKGKWSVVDGDGTGGTYYAIAKKKTGKTKKGKKYTCPRAVSGPFTR